MSISAPGKLPARVFAFIFALSFALRLGAAWVSGYLFRMQLTEMLLIALNFAGGRGYVDPFGFNSGPTAHSTPPFPLLLAAVIMIFGTGRLGQAVISTIACAAAALRCALTPAFVEDAGLGRGVTILTAVLSVIYIGALRTEVSGGVDAPLVSLALLAIIWMSFRLWRSGSWMNRTPVVFFAVCGFSVLLSPQLLPVIAGVFAACAVACEARFRNRVFWLGAGQVGTICLFLLPWGIRNWVEMDAFIPLRGNLGMELWLSNGPGRGVEQPDNEKFDPTVNRAEAQKLVEFGEVEYNRQKMREALGWIGENPGEFGRLTLLRFIAWWFPRGNVATVISKAALTLFAFAGLWILWRRQRTLAVLFGVTWITMPDLYYFLHWSSRYRYPMDSQLLICASVTIEASWRNYVLRRTNSRNLLVRQS